MGSSEVPLKEYSFPLERFFAKSRLAHSYYSAPLIYWAVATIISTILTSKIAPSFNMFLWEVEYWIMPGTLSFVLAIISIKYVRDRSIEFLRLLRSFLSNDNFKTTDELFKKLYTRRFHALIATVGAGIAMIFQTYFVIIKPHPWWISYYETNYQLALAQAWLVVITAGITYLLAGTLLCFVIGNIYAVRWLCRKIINVNVAHPDEFGGLLFFSTYIRSIVIAWLIATLPWLHTYIFAVVTWWTLFILTLYFMSTVSILSILTYYFHETMTYSRRKALEEVAKLHDEIRSIALKYLDKEKMVILEGDILKGILLNMTLQNIGRSAESIRMYPFRIGGAGLYDFSDCPPSQSHSTRVSKRVEELLPFLQQEKMRENLQFERTEKLTAVNLSRVES